MIKPKVVIGLPVYNGEKHIAAAIKSHLSQSFGNFELIIADNASTDQTVEICEEFARSDKRVTVLRSSENKGILWTNVFLIS